MEEYDKAVHAKEVRNQRLAEGKVIIRGKDLPWELNRQGRIKHFLRDWQEQLNRSTDYLAAPGWEVFHHEIRKHSSMHRHQGGTFLFVLGGQGSTTVNGVRYDWEAGDLILLPMVPGGVAHQHFNRDPGVPAVFMRIAYALHKDPVIANWLEQLELSLEWADKKGIQERKVAPMVNHARTTDGDDAPRGDTLFDTLLRLRNRQREEIKSARMVIQGRFLAQEINPMGLFRWYIHPQMKDVGCRAQIIYLQEIPAGSRSGKQLHQGGRFHYVLEGSGSIVIDEVRHDWDEGDIILLPVKSHGVVHQLFNSDLKRIARLLVSEPNWVDVWGVDMGSGLEMVEPAPEYQQSRQHGRPT
jgi:uncharacterized cupin superfamily protein